jgi:hypothetical protein
MILKKNVHVAFIGIPFCFAITHQDGIAVNAELVVPMDVFNTQIKFVLFVIFQLESFAKVPFQL